MSAAGQTPLQQCFYDNCVDNMLGIAVDDNGKVRMLFDQSAIASFNALVVAAIELVGFEKDEHDGWDDRGPYSVNQFTQGRPRQP